MPARIAIVMLMCCAVAGCRSVGPDSAAWSKYPSGLMVRLQLGKRALEAGETTTAELIVVNTSRRALRIPTPDAGTVVFDLGDGRAIVAQPGRLDRWTTLDAGERASYTVNVSWERAGTFAVQATLRARSGPALFKPVTSPKVDVTILPASAMHKT